MDLKSGEIFEFKKVTMENYNTIVNNPVYMGKLTKGYMLKSIIFIWITASGET